MKFMIIGQVILLGVILHQSVQLTDGLENVLGRCCTLGTRWAWDNNTCFRYPTPVSNIPPEHQGPCLSTIGACCQRNYRERLCMNGHETAKSGNECENGPGHDGHFAKDCCEGCKLGLIAGAMGLDCEFHSLKIALGPPWDISITRCCLNAGGHLGSGGGGDGDGGSLTLTPVGLKPSHLAVYETENSQGQGSTTTTFSFRPTTPTPPDPDLASGGGDVCSQFHGQLCSHNCISEGPGSFRCTCRDGFILLPDAKSCQALDPSLSVPGPRGGGGSSEAPKYLVPGPKNPSSPSSSKCPVGFTFNKEAHVCHDLDECGTPEGLSACLPYKTCRNTVGSFICEQTPRENEQSLQCPPGYRHENGICVDIDECDEKMDICQREIHYCINTPGGFDCRGKKEFNRYNCPAGYKFNNNTLNCEDMDECSEKMDSCDRGTEVCRNTAGAYECDLKCRDGFRFDPRLRTCQDINECREGTHECSIEHELCFNVPGSYQCHQQKPSVNNCPLGYEQNQNFTFLCQDIDECARSLDTCSVVEKCVNEIGGYRCDPLDDGLEGSSSTSPHSSTTAATPEDEGLIDNIIPDSGGDPLTTPDRIQRTALLEPQQPSAPDGNSIIEKDPGSPCALGFRPTKLNHDDIGACEDIDECLESSPCDSSQLCQNTIGSYYCHCRSGYYRDPITRACLDLNECQTGQHNCQPTQRCDNNPGSFVCIRMTGCGTGYTLNSQTGQCEDDDECLFGNHDCDRLGPGFECKNTLGSFRCESPSRNCPVGLSMAPTGECRPSCPTGHQFNHRGECVDIDECKVVPGIRSICPPHQQCVNTQGSYRCISKIICPSGYEPEGSGTKCVDMDECRLGVHTCTGNQQCVNRGGGYICQCSSGYTMTASTCEDINECERGQMCASNAECHNTQGSYRCICKDGFEQGADNRTCTDVDECKSITGLCEQNCINTWGSYICSCGVGFTLGEDGRSCIDVNECEQVKDGYLCIGNCVNTRGSYKCTCPDGYRLGVDGRTCHDIDECQGGDACRPDENCLNTRGGLRCNRVTCPYGYSKETDQNDRCKRTLPCLETDAECIKQPLTISRNFISFTSNIRIPSIGYVDMFTMRGPSWPGAVMHFNLELKSNRAPSGVQVATRQHFLLRRPTSFQAVVALAKPIAGPQDVELELTMEVYHQGKYAGSAVAQIVIVVTSYEY